MSGIILALALLADPPPPKAPTNPSLSWEQRSAFWRAQTAHKSAAIEIMATQKGLDAAIAVLRAACSAEPIINTQGEPDCPEPPPQQPPVPPAKKSGTQ